MRVLLPLVIAFGAAACAGPEPDFAVGTVERDRIELVAWSSEPIVAIRVQEGQRVAVGAPLIEQDTAMLSVVLARAQAEVALAQARLREAEAGPRAQEIERARSRLAAASSVVETARHELGRQQSLVSRNYASESQIDILRSQVDEAAARQDEARSALDELLEGTRSEQLDQARAAHAAASARADELAIELERTVLRAPVDALVEALPYEVGERPQPGRTVVALLDVHRLYARVHIPQPLRTRLSSGASAELRVDGFAEAFSGRVRWISSDAAFTPFFALTQHDRSRLAYLAEIDFESSVDLPAGIPVEVRFPGSGAPEDPADE